MPVTNLLKEMMDASHPAVQRRRAICQRCTHRTNGWVSSLLPGQIGAYCKACWCIIVLKTRCPDERCEMGYWEKENVRNVRTTG